MWLFGGNCHSQVLLTGKTAIVTGGNTGIGKETAKDFYKRGARVIIACRDVDKGECAVKEIMKDCQTQTGNGTLIIKKLELDSLSKVRQCAQEILETESHINLLINNAGVFCCPERYTKDGHESHFGVNHLGHFLFTLLLLPRILEANSARIVNLSSIAHKNIFSGGIIDFDDLNFEKRTFHHIPAYAQSKLANILFTKELAKKLKEHNVKVTTYSVHPGVISTELGRNFNLLFPGVTYLWKSLSGLALKTPKQGAQTTIYCAVDEQVANETGLYYSNCKVTEPSEMARNKEAAEKLWEISVKLVGLENYDPFKMKIDEDDQIISTDF